jgi:putative transposase
VQKMCEVLDLSGSGYYDWVSRPESEKDKEDKKLLKKIKRVHKESRKTYGVRRVTKQLNKEGISCGKTRVGRLMRENNIYCKTRKKYKATTNSKHNYPVAPNLLEQDFEAEKPDEKYVGDITYVWTDEGWLYLAGVEDLFNRELIGWKISSRMTVDITLSAMDMAIGRRAPEEGLIFHSDRGSQYAANAYKELLKKYGIRQSMSRKGNCYDNACAESFFSSLKKDAIYGTRFRTREEAKKAIIDYIEGFYNSRRLHSSLGYKSPREYINDYYRNEKEAA